MFIINGHEKYGTKEGRVNRTLVDYMVTVLGENQHVKTTTIQDGYHIKAEHDKL
ncbi:flavodoxin family protein, partial [Bacillus cereus]|nr:flavodoxin family protein [Bacillus cereus]